MTSSEDIEQQSGVKFSQYMEHFGDQVSLFIFFAYISISVTVYTAKTIFNTKIVFEARYYWEAS